MVVILRYLLQGLSPHHQLTSIFPGVSGSYDSYLSGTKWLVMSTCVTPQPGHPSYVDYRMCGLSAAGSCAPPAFLRSIRIYMSAPLVIQQISPLFFAQNNPLCTYRYSERWCSSYTFAWTNDANGAGVVVGNGLTYTATEIGIYSLSFTIKIIRLALHLLQM